MPAANHLIPSQTASQDNSLEHNVLLGYAVTIPHQHIFLANSQEKTCWLRNSIQLPINQRVHITGTLPNIHGALARDLAIVFICALIEAIRLYDYNSDSGVPGQSVSDDETCSPPPTIT